ncbi:MAG: hypothetical protein LBC70_04540 [Chitinispirillales bacterium]|jgi:energy-coupling factor transporter ATP-binding protein EcfA2|nr:hypothetical protein [Chitinispirillales bacterium]
MKRLKIELENCYGIKKMNAMFDFSEKNVIAIYAPNGAMKTSFAKTLKDICVGNKTVDRIYTARETIRKITNDENKELVAEEVFVIEPYDEEYKSEKVSTLLVDEELRKEYETIYEEINKRKQDLLKNLKKTSGFKKEQDIENNLSQDISHKKDFFTALKRIKDEISDYTKNPKGFEKIQYISVFNDKSIDLLKDKAIMDNLSEYITIYDKLLDTSTFFKKGIFNHNNATDIAKRLNDNGWFKASHSVNIKEGHMEKKVASMEELETAIKKEKENIINNNELEKAFEKLDKTLAKNQANKDFRDYIGMHKEILPELKEYEAFKEKLWIAYLAQNKNEYDALLNLYDESKEKIQKIVDEAKKQSTRWQEVINEFNERYTVPFKLKMDNQASVILSNEIPVVKFDFVEGDEVKPVERQDLLEVLSQGEKRALYILNIIFEVEARKATSQETLFVIDDIADSFDYKNKYAIIEYLKDIAKNDGFSLIVLTHNFDFHRNLTSRMGIGASHGTTRKNRLCAVKYTDRIELEEEKYQNNPFNNWKEFKDVKHEIAAIPFVRNLAEFCGENDVANRLTGLLHQKTDTATITMRDLLSIFKELIEIPDNTNSFQGNSVEERIYEIADKICTDTTQKMELEDKIILSIAIRLKAEKYMINRISDSTFIVGIKKNQTYELTEKYKTLFFEEKEIIRLLDKVNLMTPENIHINSFMYEPILDMSNEHLKMLYDKVSALLL